MHKFVLLAAMLMLPTSVASEHNSAEVETPSSWALPFSTPHRLIRAYLQPNSDYSAGHRGVDYSVSLKEPLYAPSDGTVSVVKFLVNRGVITISHGSGLVTELEPACSTLAEGTIVSRGDQIGFVCAAGASYLGHCQNELCEHFSLRVRGRYMSPLALIGGLSPSRLLPPQS
jgi:murein DD-endopeptidase MepM/ murein hydrolase activator NlpD